MTDEERIAHLMGEPGHSLDEADRAGLDDLRELLRDPAVWAVPPEDLEDRVVSAIGREVAAPPERVAASGHRRRRRGGWTVTVLAAGAAAAAVVVAAVLAGGLVSGRDGGTRVYVALAAEGAARPSATATLTRTDAGWRIQLDAGDLPGLDNGAYYQAWLKNNVSGVLVPVGTFNQGGHVTLWAGVSPVDYPLFTVTVEAADGNQASSGQRVLSGTVSTTRPK